MTRVSGKVAIITGGARGQGRSHALRLAEEGADIAIIDACAPIDAVNYDFPTVADLGDTAAMIEKLDRRVIARQVDVRDQDGLDQVVADAVDEFGGIDIVVANAAIVHVGAPAWELTDEQWLTTVDINLTGTWRTIKAALPSMVDQGRRGSVIHISSVAGSKGIPAVSHYVAAKHGVIGMARTLANELGEHRIRVNCVQPGNVRTPMITNEHGLKAFRPDLESPTVDDVSDIMGSFTALPVDLLEPVHQQRRPLARLRRGPLRHRHLHPRRRGMDQPLGQPPGRSSTGNRNRHQKRLTPTRRSCRQPVAEI